MTTPPPSPGNAPPGGSPQDTPDAQPTPYPAGHYHSPIPSIDEVRADEARIFAAPTNHVRGVDLNEATQLETLDSLAAHVADLPYRETPVDGYRFCLDNAMFGHGDTTVLWTMLHHLRPRRYLEIGSGYSSAIAMDANEHSFDFAMKCKFIEPDISRLRSLSKPEDHWHGHVFEARVEHVELKWFDILESNDVFFIDSSHVSRVGSDVNYLFFEVLPRLRPGVVVHVHDIFYPFEYPKEWVYRGRVWNEAYLLRAFLTFNDAFEIIYFNDYIAKVHRDRLEQKMPICLKNPGGSIWLRRKDG